MELEFQQLDRRYEDLRSRDPEREKQLLGSLSERGQQVPIVVVCEVANRYVVIDGYKRVRALRRLRNDTVSATTWALCEPDALILDRLLRASGRDSVLEEAWLLADLQRRFGLAESELGRRFDRSVSWISRRLGLVRALPPEVQEQVRRGRIVAHAAMKYLLPLARANAEQCVALVRGLPTRRLSSRELGRLYTVWVTGDAQTRARLVAEPELFLRVAEESRRAAPTLSEGLISDLRVLCAVSARSEGRVRQGAASGLSRARQGVARRLVWQARAAFSLLLGALSKEGLGAGPDDAGDGAAAGAGGPWQPCNRKGVAALAGSGEASALCRDGRGAEPGAGGEG